MFLKRLTYLPSPAGTFVAGYLFKLHKRSQKQNVCIWFSTLALQSPRTNKNKKKKSSNQTLFPWVVLRCRYTKKKNTKWMPIQFCRFWGLVLLRGDGRAVFLPEQPLRWLIPGSRSRWSGMRDAESRWDAGAVGCEAMRRCSSACPGAHLPQPPRWVWTWPAPSLGPNLGNARESKKGT